MVEIANTQSAFPGNGGTWADFNAFTPGAYPNLTLGWVTLTNDQATPQAVEVLNALGQRLLDLPLEAHATHRYDLSDLLPGVYFLPSATGTTRLVRQ